MLTVYAIVGAGQRSIGLTSALAAVSLALFVAFILRQARAARLRSRLFRSRLLTGANRLGGAAPEPPVLKRRTG